MKNSHSAKNLRKEDKSSSRSSVKVDGELDLHGQTVSQALGAVNRLLQRSDLRNGSVWRVIHGHSNNSEDSIKSQLHPLLRSRWSRRLSDYYLEPLNPGSTLLIIDSDLT